MLLPTSSKASLRAARLRWARMERSGSAMPMANSSKSQFKDIQCLLFLKEAEEEKLSTLEVLSRNRTTWLKISFTNEVISLEAYKLTSPYSTLNQSIP